MTHTPYTYYRCWSFNQGTMLTLLAPIYVKSCDLQNKNDDDLALYQCEPCDQVTPGQIIGDTRPHPHETD